MNHNQWRKPVSRSEAIRRAAGRNRFNRRRRLAAELQMFAAAELLLGIEKPPWRTQPGRLPKSCSSIEPQSAATLQSYANVVGTRSTLVSGPGRSRG